MRSFAASLTAVSLRPNAASDLGDLISWKESRAHEETASSKWDYFSLMCK
jgi:hypothetical protein